MGLAFLGEVVPSVQEVLWLEPDLLGLVDHPDSLRVLYPLAERLAQGQATHLLTRVVTTLLEWGTGTWTGQTWRDSFYQTKVKAKVLVTVALRAAA